MSFRGELPDSLERIRSLADQQYIYERNYLQQKQSKQPLSDSLSQRFMSATSKSCTCCGNTRNSRFIPSSTAPLPVSPITIPSDNASCYLCESIDMESEQKINIIARSMDRNSKGSEIIARNFRELLWYWREYYLRRGRDRLSIEFSSHIPFRYWNELVGKR